MPGRKTVHYIKPEIHNLGDASGIISDFTKSDHHLIEFVDPTSLQGFTPAYDLDD
jgi:hypothetical protein